MQFEESLENVLRADAVGTWLRPLSPRSDCRWLLNSKVRMKRSLAKESVRLPAEDDLGAQRLSQKNVTEVPLSNE
jgi:hypothetical protein